MNTTKRTEISSLGEFGFVERLTKDIKPVNKETVKGIGDDAAILQFGSYFQAKEHTAVLSRISGKTMSWLLDVATVVTLFAIGFVMFAGGGSNLEQQFGWPVWVGALLMLVLVLVTGMLDVDKVSKIIGAVTPFVIVFIVFVTVWTLFTADYDVAGLNVAAQEIQTTLPNCRMATPLTIMSTDAKRAPANPQVPNATKNCRASCPEAKPAPTITPVNARAMPRPVLNMLLVSFCQGGGVCHSNVRALPLNWKTAKLATRIRTPRRGGVSARSSSAPAR